MQLICDWLCDNKATVITYNSFGFDQSFVVSKGALCIVVLCLLNVPSGAGIWLSAEGASLAGCRGVQQHIR